MRDNYSRCSQYRAGSLSSKRILVTPVTWWLRLCTTKMGRVLMSTAIQKALATARSGTSQALSLLDDTMLAMIMGQNPLPKILDALCSDIEKHHLGMMCSVLLLDGDGVTLRHGAAPSFPPE